MQPLREWVSAMFAPESSPEKPNDVVIGLVLTANRMLATGARICQRAVPAGSDVVAGVLGVVVCPEADQLIGWEVV